MRIKITIYALLALLLLNGLLSGMIVYRCSAEESVNTLYVGSTETYKTIQKAINAANNGDTIDVSNGLYIENLVIEKSITFIGENINTTIIKGATIDPVIKVTASDVRMTDFQIKGNIIDKNNRSKSAISLINSSYINITACHLIDSQVALRIQDSTDISISACNITNNDVGVFSLNSSHISIVNTDITTHNLNGVSIINSSFIHVSYSTISYSKGSGIALQNSQNNSITFNIIKNNSGYGVAIYQSSKIISVSGSDNVNFSNVTQTVVVQYPSLGNDIYENNFIGNNINAYDGYKNSWDNGAVGNYWDDYYGEDLNGDNIGDISYMFFGNQDYYPLMTPVGYAGTANVTLPTVKINAPLDGATVNGTITFSGVSSNPNGEIQEVLIKVAGDPNWTKVHGTTTWFYTLNTTSYKNGEYKVSARSTDGKRYSLLSEITLIVKNPAKENGKSNGSTPGFETIFMLLSIFIIVFFFKITHKKR